MTLTEQLESCADEIRVTIAEYGISFATIFSLLSFLLTQTMIYQKPVSALHAEQQLREAWRWADGKWHLTDTATRKLPWYIRFAVKGFLLGLIEAMIPQVAKLHWRG